MRGTQKGDVYSFGIILYEIFGRDGPYGKTVFQEEDIVALVRDPEPGKDFYRPDIEALKDTDLDYKAEDYILGKISKAKKSTGLTKLTRLAKSTRLTRITRLTKSF